VDPSRHWCVGDRVILRIGLSARTLVVIEDRGPLAPGGEQVVAIRGVDADGCDRFEMPSALLEPAA
jgi:hypothetical protein